MVGLVADDAALTELMTPWTLHASSLLRLCGLAHGDVGGGRWIGRGVFRMVPVQSSVVCRLPLQCHRSATVSEATDMPTLVDLNRNNDWVTDAGIRALAETNHGIVHFDIT